MKQSIGIIFFFILTLLSYAQNEQGRILGNNGLSGWPSDTLDLSEPILDRVFPGVRFFLPPANPNMGDGIEIHAEYKEIVYLFIGFHRVDFNTLFEQVKSKANCTLEDRIKALLFLHTYINENFVWGPTGIWKHEKYQFKIDLLVEEKNIISEMEFQWYAKCSSQKGYLDIYILYGNNKHVKDRIISLYVVNSSSQIEKRKTNGMFSAIN